MHTFLINIIPVTRYMQQKETNSTNECCSMLWLEYTANDAVPCVNVWDGEMHPPSESKAK